MAADDLTSSGDGMEQPVQLPGPPPYVWPEARALAGVGGYESVPPVLGVLERCDLISGVLVGAADQTVRWLDGLLGGSVNRRVSLVVVLYQAGPTREHHLRALAAMQQRYAGDGSRMEVKLLPMTRQSDGDAERFALPPTVLMGQDRAANLMVMSIGSVGDAGHDRFGLGSLNLVLTPDDAVRDAWRRWFQYAFTAGAPLNERTLLIPHLVPAAGNEEAAKMWSEFEQRCFARVELSKQPEVEPETGEVLRDPEGEAVKPWDDGDTKLNPLARVFQEVYSGGWLVTVDETTRLRPLSVPVSAVLMGQKAERAVGSLKQKQSFTLRVLDDASDRAIEGCRKVTNLVSLLTFPLSQGNRWLPAAARELLERELDFRDIQGRKLLVGALGGTSIDDFLDRREKDLRRDLNAMYRELGQGDVVPENKVKDILSDVRRRLQQALEARIAPRACYNRISPPDLTASAPDENWGQPLLLLATAANTLRKALSDSFFPRQFKNLSFTMNDFTAACDPFGDAILTDPDLRRANLELDQIAAIMGADESAQRRCERIWALVRGTQS